MSNHIDNFPVIPDNEYILRWQKVQELLKKHRLDLIVAYADDHAVNGPAYARWLADFPVHFEPVWITLSMNDEPFLFCGPESEEYAYTKSKLKNIKVLKEFTHPDEDYPYTKIFSFKQILEAESKVFRNIKRVGVAGAGLMNNELYNVFKDSFQNAELIDIEREMSMLRSVKSAAEINVIKKAYKIAEIGMQCAVEATKAGITEREISAAAECAMRSAGAEGMGIDTIVASGLNNKAILARSTFRRVQKDDLVLITVAPRYEGYHGAIGRPIFIGNLRSEIIHARNILKKAQFASIEAACPGILGRDVESVARKIMDEEGLGKYFAYSGVHSVGVIEFELPIFGPSSNDRILKDMVISIDIPMFNAPWGGMRYEDGFLVTDSGLIRLEEVPYEFNK